MLARTSIVALAFASLTASAASAAISGTTGAALQIGPPSSCVPGALSGFTAFAWDEQTNIPLTGWAVNMVNNPANHITAIPGTVTGLYDSHMIHYEQIPGAIPASGTVSFSAPIDAVIFRNLDLTASDAPMGSFGTIYPTGYPFRDIGVNPNNFFSILGNTLTFNFSSVASVPAVVQVRVLTKVPTPGVVSIAGLAGLASLRRSRRAH